MGSNDRPKAISSTKKAVKKVFRNTCLGILRIFSYRVYLMAYFNYKSFKLVFPIK